MRKTNKPGVRWHSAIVLQARIMSLRSGLGECGKHHLGRMRDYGEQRARRPAWRALALFPVPDGFDGHAEARGKFLLRQLRAAAKIAHLDRTSAHFPKSALHRRNTFSRTSESYGH